MTVNITGDEVRRLWAAGPDAVLLVRDDAVMVLPERDVTVTDVYVAHRDAYARYAAEEEMDPADLRVMNAYARILTATLEVRGNRRVLSIREWGQAIGMRPDTLYHAVHRALVRAENAQEEPPADTPPADTPEDVPLPYPDSVVANTVLYDIGLIRWLRGRPPRRGRPRRLNPALDAPLLALLRAGKSFREAAEALGIDREEAAWRVRRMRDATGRSTAELIGTPTTTEHAQ